MIILISGFPNNFATTTLANNKVLPKLGKPRITAIHFLLKVTEQLYK